MTTDILSDADEAHRDEATLYYVVPLKPKDQLEQIIERTEKIVDCAYFDKEWKRVGSTLDTTGGTQKIRFTERCREIPPQALEQLGGRKPDPTVTLFAAVAKTLRTSCGLPNTFVAKGADGATWLTIPVDLKTSRGVVLVFRRPESGGAETLIATTDPEIRNGSST